MRTPSLFRLGIQRVVFFKKIFLSSLWFTGIFTIFVHAQVDVEITLNNQGASAYFIEAFSPAEARIGNGGILHSNPTITLEIGKRYKVTIVNATIHPFELIAKANSDVDDIVLLSMGAVVGSLESDAEIDWVDTPEDGSVTFTLTQNLVNAMSPDADHQPGYRCRIHRSMMRGNIAVNPSGSTPGILHLNFDFLHLYTIPSGSNSFASSVQTTLPFWFLEGVNRNNLETAASLFLEEVVIFSPLELLNVMPVPDKVDTPFFSFEYTWNNVEIPGSGRTIFLAEQENHSGNRSMAFSVERQGKLNGIPLAFPMQLNTDGEIELTVLVTPTASSIWTDLNIFVAFYGVSGELIRPFFDPPSNSPFASLSLVSRIKPDSFEETETKEKDRLISINWDSTSGIVRQQTLEFKATVAFDLEDGVQSAVVEPMVLVSGNQSSDNGSESWINRKLNLSFPSGTTITVLEDIPDTTETTLNPVGIRFYDRGFGSIGSDTFSISGMVTDNSTIVDGDIIIQAIANTGASNPTKHQITLNNPGTYTFDNLPAGAYRLSAFIDADQDGIFDFGTELKSEFPNDGRPSVISGSAGAEFTEVNFEFSDPDQLFFLHGFITDETGRTENLFAEVYTDAELMNPVRTVQAEADGEYVIQDLFPGQYYVSVFRDINLNGQFDREFEPFSIYSSGTEPTAIDLTTFSKSNINVRIGAPTILFSLSGKVTRKSVHPGKLLVQAVENRQLNPLKFPVILDETGPDSSVDYTISNLPPGPYFVIASIDSNDNELDDPTEVFSWYPTTANTQVVNVGPTDVTGIDITIDDHLQNYFLSGTLTNESFFSGTTFIEVSTESDFSTIVASTTIQIQNGGKYTLSGLPVGSFFLRAWIDTDFTNTFNPNTEPFGIYPNPESPQTISLGLSKTNIDFTIKPPPTFSISGTVTNASGQEGPIVVELSQSSEFFGPFGIVSANEMNQYVFTNPIEGNYYVRAFIDGNSNFFYDTGLEPVGFYELSPGGGPTSVSVGPDIAGINITIGSSTGGNNGFLSVDFDLVAAIQIPPSETSFSGGTFSITPEWFLDIQNEADTPGTQIHLNSISFSSDQELTALVPTPNSMSTSPNFQYVWENISLNDQDDDFEIFAEQSSVSEQFTMAFNVSYSAEVNGVTSEIPIPIGDGDTIKVTIELTPTDSGWQDLDVELVFPGFNAENVNPFEGIPPGVQTFATLVSQGATGPVGIEPEIDVESDPPLVSFEWEILNNITINETMTFSGAAKYTFLDGVQSALLEPFLIVGGSRSEHEGTENWNGSTLTLPSNHGGQVQLDGASPNETDTSLYSLGVKFYDRATSQLEVKSSISGSFVNNGEVANNYYIQVFTNSGFTELVKESVQNQTGNFLISDLSEGTYYLRIFADVNGNMAFNPASDPVGTYRIGGVPKQLILTQDVTGIEIILQNDMDEDGLSDDWENSNGLNPNSAVGVHGTLGDQDGDLLSNFDEFETDSDPRKPTIKFNRGWNLLSWPKEFVAGTTLSAQLADVPIQGSVWTWDEENRILFQVNSGNDGVNRESAMLPTNGYWVYSKENYFLDVDRDVPGNISKSLHVDWNLVGGVHGGDIPADSAITVFWEIEGTRYFVPNNLSATKGYWVHSSSSTSIQNWR